MAGSLTRFSSLLGLFVGFVCGACSDSVVFFWDVCGDPVEFLWDICGAPAEFLWDVCGDSVIVLGVTCGVSVGGSMTIEAFGLMEDVNVESESAKSKLSWLPELSYVRSLSSRETSLKDIMKSYSSKRHLMKVWRDRRDTLGVTYSQARQTTQKLFCGYGVRGFLIERRWFGCWLHTILSLYYAGNYLI